MLSGLGTALPREPDHVSTRAEPAPGPPERFSAAVTVRMPATYLHSVVSVCCVGGRVGDVIHFGRTRRDVFSRVASGVLVFTHSKSPEVTYARMATFPGVP